MRVHEPEELRDDERRPREPAPLPLHAALALQQSAGNQAVGRVLARAKFKPKARETKLQGANKGKTKPANADELLLKVYNELRVGGTPAFTKVSDAVDALKLAGVIEDDDAAAFAAAASKMFGGGKKDVGAAMLEELKAKVAEKRPGIDGQYKQHIFFGDFKADKQTPTGYHSIKGPSTTHERYGAKTVVPTDATGVEVYQQSVRSIKAPDKKKQYQSTFFPDNVEMDEVLDAITSVYGMTPQPKTVQYPAKLKGMKLRKTGGTVYPESEDKNSE